jgi:4-alpha-glucanotransferase
MNIPGQPGGNWRWRMTADLPSQAAFAWLQDLTTQVGRSAADLPTAAPATLQIFEVKS